MSNFQDICNEVMDVFPDDMEMSHIVNVLCWLTAEMGVSLGDAMPKEDYLKYVASRTDAAYDLCIKRDAEEKAKLN